MTGVVLVLTTVPAGGDHGERMARALVDERLAACVNVHGPMTSIYRWRGAVECETERQLVVKTTADRVEAVRARIVQLHSYEVPEFLVIAIEDGSANYLEWVRAQT